jgi:hypothetical protein
LKRSDIHAKYLESVESFHATAEVKEGEMVKTRCRRLNANFTTCVLDGDACKFG